MGRTVTVSIAVCLLAAFVITGSSCAIRPRLKVENAASTAVKGRYSLILYGCTHFNDLRTMAILDREGDLYTIEPYAPDFDYRVIKNLPAREALKRAGIFVSSCGPDFMQSRLSMIVTKGGGVAGYEVMPLYWSYAYPGSDVLDTYYFMKKDKIIAVIRLKHRVEMMREDDFGRRAR
ncbi:MAG: hypothetical protein P8Z71_06140 [Candidatus Sulfobium sp.]